MSQLYKSKFKTESMRLKDWNYSQSGFYFVTICTKNHQMIFGDIIKSGTEYCPIYKMKLSEIGEIVKKYWLEIPKHFPNVSLDEHIIMPNHIHGIIEIDNNNDMIDNNENTAGAGRDAINRVSTGGITGKNNPMGKRNLGEIIRWYKGRCTFEINKIIDNNYFVWQSRYYDHIIRNEKSLDEIRKYISDNPAIWDLDKNNVENLYM